MLKINKLYNLDCREGLKQLENDSIDCVISSPPYWSLRDYGIEASIWDDDPNCEHEFEIKEKEVESYKNKGGFWQNDEISRKTSPETWSKVKIQEGFCSKCGAWKGTLGLEPNFELFIKHLCDIYDDVKRVLKPTGTCWVNLGDTYGGTGAGQEKSLNSQGKYTDGQYFKNAKSRELKSKTTKKYAKCLLMLPQRFAIEMISRGWILRNVIIWHKPNCMPSSAKDRFTVDFEYVYFFVKKKKYWFEQQREKSTTEFIYSRTSQKGENQEKNNPRKNWGKTKEEIKIEKSKYKTLENESKNRQGMHKARGTNLIEKRNLPDSKLFVDAIRKRFTIKELVEKTGIKSTTIDHWFTYPESSHGFAFPTKEQWVLVETEIFPELLEVYYETDDICKKTPLIGYTKEELQEITKKEAGWDRWSRKYNLGIGGKRDAPQEIQQNQNYIPISSLGRNKRTVWKIPTKPNPEAHFATFPPDLVKPMIKSGCPEFICKKCGKPRERIIEKGKTYHQHCKDNNLKWSKEAKSSMENSQFPWNTKLSGQAHKEFKEKNPDILKGYSDCGCNAGFEPGIVLDPFAGVGTTLKEAWKLGRNYIGFEISKEYCEIGNRLLKSTKNKRIDEYTI